VTTTRMRTNYVNTNSRARLHLAHARAGGGYLCHASPFALIAMRMLPSSPAALVSALTETYPTLDLSVRE